MLGADPLPCQSPGCPNHYTPRKWSKLRICDDCRTRRLRKRQRVKDDQRLAAMRARNDRIRRLRHEEGWTLNFIAREVGLTRQRVQQILAQSHD